ncbi:MAG: hypothetical protein M3552_03020 [Planctomycetota bacterium]|nr:hypothetical protein [Planctomycetota bacterium]
MADLDLLIRSKGGRFALEKAKGELGELVGYFHGYLQETLELWQTSGPLVLSAAFRDTTFAFLSERALDCFVYPGGRGNFVGMSVGYPLILANTCFALLAHPEVLPEVGNTGAETRWSPEAVLPKTQSAKQLDLSTDDLRQAGFFRLPRDPERLRYATDLTLDALTFLLYHEIAHIFRGHMHVHRQATGFSFLDESEALLPTSAFGFDVPVGEASVTAGELTQFFEIDADAVAADTLMYEKAPMDFPESAGRFEEIVARLNRALVAVAILFMTTATPRSLTQYRTSKYPHPRTRYQLAFVFATSTVIRLLKLPDHDRSLPELRRLLAPAIGAIKTIRARLNWADSIGDEPDEAFAADFDDRHAFHGRIQDRLFVGKSTLAPLDGGGDPTPAGS